MVFLIERVNAYFYSKIIFLFYKILSSRAKLNVNKLCCEKFNMKIFCQATFLQPPPLTIVHQMRANDHQYCMMTIIRLKQEWLDLSKTQLICPNSCNSSNIEVSTWILRLLLVSSSQDFPFMSLIKFKTLWRRIAMH